MSRPRVHTAPAKAGAGIRGDVLLTLAQLRLATPRRLKALLLPHHQDTDYVRRALRNLRTDALVGRPHRAQQSYWYCTPAGLAEVAASGELPPKAGRATGQRAAAKTGLREHTLTLVDTVIAFHHAGAADQADWQVEVARPTAAGSLGPDGVGLLNNGSHAFVEIDRTMSYACLLAKLERYDAYRHVLASGRGNAARTPRSHWQETYAGPSLERPFPPLLFVFAPAQRRAAPATREAAFHDRARPNWRITRGHHAPASADRARARPAGVAGRRPRSEPSGPGHTADAAVNTTGSARPGRARLQTRLPESRSAKSLVAVCLPRGESCWPALYAKARADGGRAVRTEAFEAMATGVWELAVSRLR
ncbi:replication-relaxation family protein [Streptomyces nondiastaticus]|uniref:replication-relaxation family protein n=1 Tax=Streptomyces nondiastaticus TaxID=3154512 RepID=UPI00342F6377